MPFRKEFDFSKYSISEKYLIKREVKCFSMTDLSLTVSFALEFQCDYFCESSCLFYLSLNSDVYVSKIMYL